jgi:hypothetical protein
LVFKCCIEFQCLFTHSDNKTSYVGRVTWVVARGHCWLFRAVGNTTWRCRWTQVRVWDRPCSKQLLHGFCNALTACSVVIKLVQRLRSGYFLCGLSTSLPPQRFRLQWYFRPNSSQNVCDDFTDTFLLPKEGRTMGYATTNDATTNECYNVHFLSIK